MQTRQLTSAAVMTTVTSINAFSHVSLLGTTAKTAIKLKVRSQFALHHQHAQRCSLSQHSRYSRQLLPCRRTLTSTSVTKNLIEDETRTDENIQISDKVSNNEGNGHGWNEVLPMQPDSHNSMRINVPLMSDMINNDESSSNNNNSLDPFRRDGFIDRLKSTINACLQMQKSALWISVPLARASLIQDMADCGLTYHHAMNETAVLNLWLRSDVPSKIPAFATHNVGVGAVVIDQDRDCILVVRELRKNYLPWKVPTGLSDLTESIEDAAVREVYEETGIKCKFTSILAFRQTHNLAHGQSDLFFVCKLDPIIENSVSENCENKSLPDPVPQVCEIERAAWIPLSEYKKMVADAENGHPMMHQIMQVIEEDYCIEKKIVNSIVPGRKPNAIYYPTSSSNNSSHDNTTLKKS